MGSGGKQAHSKVGPLVETVEIAKPDGGGLGLIIGEDEEAPGVYVQKVVFNEPAYLDGRLKRGDKILAINGHSTRSAGQDFVFKLLQVCMLYVCVYAFMCMCTCELAHSHFSLGKYNVGGVRCFLSLLTQETGAKKSFKGSFC